jgi:hypothetical protein
LPQPLRGHSHTLSAFAEAYEAIDAPTGSLRCAGLSTPALAGNDATYAALEDQITDLTNRRNAIAADMTGMLGAAEFQSQRIDVNEAERLTDEAEELVGSVSPVSRGAAELRSNGSVRSRGANEFIVAITGPAGAGTRIEERVSKGRLWE